MAGVEVEDQDVVANCATVAFPRFEAPAPKVAEAWGAVYKARLPHLDRVVALKILPKSLAET